MMSLFQGSSQTRSAFLLLFFLFMCFKPAQTEVVKSISKCADFLLNKTPPEIPNILKAKKIKGQKRYKPICQTYQNTRTFLTLYDTKEKIPVFSAIKFVREDPSNSRSPHQEWMIEPQLENESADKNMKKDNEQQGTYNHQASNSDYTNSGYSRGHVCPRSYASTEIAKNSTFTLTNVVPQVESFNSGSWEKMETCVKCFMEKFCINNGVIEGYVVAGAKPGDKKLNDWVNIPSMMWSAFCCYNSDKNTWFASAHWGYNDPKKEEEYLQTKTLNKLYRNLGKHFNVFPGTKCPLGTTVTEFYPYLKKICTCPPGAQQKTNKSKDNNGKNNNNRENKNIENKNKENKNKENKNRNKNKNRENKNIETKNKNKENKNKENKNRKKENKNKNKENKNRNKNKKRENKKTRAG